MPEPAKPVVPATPPAKPATPTPAPAPAAIPTVPAPAATPPAAPTDNPFAEIDAAIKLVDEPKPTTTGKGAAPTAPPAATPPAAPAKMPKELRAEYDKLKTDFEAKTASHAELEKKIADYEKKGKDTQILLERQKTLEKQLEERDAQIRALRFEVSPEFKEKWDKPFNQAAAYAESVIGQLFVNDTETNSTRPADFDKDFRDLYNMPLNKATTLAKERFGDSYQVVMNHLTELKRMEFNRNQALEEERAKAKENATKEEANRQAQTEAVNTAWESLNKDLAESVAEYHDDPQDEELKNLRDQGYKIFDAETSTPQQRLVKNAHIRQRVAAFGPHGRIILRLKRDLAKANQELEGYRNPQPTTRRVAGQAPASSGESWEEAARKAMAGT